LIEYKYLVNEELYCEVEFYTSEPLDYDPIIEKYEELIHNTLNNEQKKILLIRKGVIFDNYLLVLKVFNKLLTLLQEGGHKNKMAYCLEDLEFKPIADVSPDLISKYNINAQLFTDCNKARDWLQTS